MEEKLTFGAYIQKKRKEKGMSQKELAKQLFITESAVSKWERGKSYPDITLVKGICEALSITEHELITASDDYEQREIEREAKGFRRVKKSYSWVLCVGYLIGLIACFICNLAIEHTLSYFFVVLAGELVAFSVLNLPVLVKENRGGITLGAFTGSILFLLMVCAIYTKGDWFFVADSSFLLGVAVIFAPIVIQCAAVPQWMKRHNALISVGIDMILTFFVILFAVTYTGNGTACIAKGIALTLLGFAPVWIFVLVIRYLPINGLFKTAICLITGGGYNIIVNGFIDLILEQKPFHLPPINFSKWDEVYLDGNIKLICLVICLIFAAIFAIGGVVKVLKKAVSEEYN